MKRYLILLAMFCLLQAVLIAAAMPLAGRPDYYLAAITDKEALLASTESPRLILVGGSNVAFGFDSVRLQRELGDRYNVVNMGLQSSLGLGFILNETLAGLRKGDVVVLSPEYGLLWSDGFLGPTMAQALYAEPRAWRYVPPDQRISFVGSAVVQSSAAMLNEFAYSVVSTQFPSLFPKRNRGPIYNRGAFNRYGDNVSNRRVSRFVVPSKSTPEQSKRMQASVSRIAEFTTEAEGRGVRVLYAFPPQPRYRWLLNRELIELTRVRLSQVPGLTVVGDPTREVYHESSFYDTFNHLTDSGVQARTEHLAEDLRRELPKAK